MNYPRRQQYRRLRRAAAAAAASLAAVWLALLAASEGSLPAAAGLLVTAIALAGYAHHHTRLAARSRVGARSEEEVQRALAPLQAEGWRLRHSLRWRGRGDIDSVAIAPTGIAFAIETNQELRAPAHGARTRDGGVAAHPPAPLVLRRRPPRSMRRPRPPARIHQGRRADRCRSTGCRRRCAPQQARVRDPRSSPPPGQVANLPMENLERPTKMRALRVAVLPDLWGLSRAGRRKEVHATRALPILVLRNARPVSC
jgi:hypothetical protein